MVTLGRFDVQFYVSTMGRYNAASGKGRIGDSIRIFGCLNHYIKLWIIYDTTLINY